jgi:hypothetical protein
VHPFRAFQETLNMPLLELIHDDLDRLADAYRSFQCLLDEAGHAHHASVLAQLNRQHQTVLDAFRLEVCTHEG